MACSVPALPVEIWEMALTHLRPYEEYQAAAVCLEWYAIVRRQRAKRGETRWKTWIGVFCNTIPRIEWARAQGCPWDQRTC
jgi:hypothetical protein